MDTTMDTFPDNHFIRITRSMTSKDDNDNINNTKSNKRKRVQFKDNIKKQKRDEDILNIFSNQLDKHVNKMKRSQLEQITKYLLCEQIKSGKVDTLLESTIDNKISKKNIKTIKFNKKISNEIRHSEVSNGNDSDVSNVNDSDVSNGNEKVVNKIVIEETNNTIEKTNNNFNINNDVLSLDDSEDIANDSELSVDDSEDIANDSELSVDESEDINDESEDIVDTSDLSDDNEDYYNFNETDKIIYNKDKYKYLKTLTCDEKDKLSIIENQIKKLNNYDIPIKYQILQSNLDLKTKAICMEKLESLQMLSEESGEFHKMKTWLDTLLKCPFNTYKDLPISISNSSLEINEYLLQVHNKLHESIHGQEIAKCQVLQYISQCITNPKSAGNVIGLCGPPGCGKTTLIKEGVSKAIDRPFAFITLGGSGGANMFEGHSYTYEGAVWGNIVNIIIQTKCMNPIIYMDELDKISNTKEGKEITGILTHLTDPSQNKEFHDRYFANIDFDLSKALIIFSYNDESKIDPILRDRLKVIYTKGYNEKDKLVIVQKYMFPSILKNIGIDPENIKLSEDMIKYIISKTDKEDGVRNLKRSLETIVSKINVYSLNSHNLLKLPFTIKNFNLPLEINKEIVDNLLEKSPIIGAPPPFMYM